MSEPTDTNLRKIIRQRMIDTSYSFTQLSIGDYFEPVLEAAHHIFYSIKAGGKIMFCGCGGSSSDSAHITAEFLNRFTMSRTHPLPAIDLTSFSSTITAIANDYDFSEIFAKPVEALATPPDILFAISTSGKSKSIIRAIEAALNSNIRVILLTGEKEPELLNSNRLTVITVPSNITAIIQELHIHVLHTICELVDEYIRESSKRS